MTKAKKSKKNNLYADPDVEVKKLKIYDYGLSKDIESFKGSFILCVRDILNNSKDETQIEELRNLKTELEVFARSLDIFIDQWKKEHPDVNDNNKQ